MCTVVKENESYSTFGPQKIKVKKSLKFTLYVIYLLLKSYKIVRTSTTFIGFLSVIFEPKM